MCVNGMHLAVRKLIWQRVPPRWFISTPDTLWLQKPRAFSSAWQVPASLSHRDATRLQSTSLESLWEKSIQRAQFTWIHGWMIDRWTELYTFMVLIVMLHSTPLLWAMDSLLFTVRQGRSSSSVFISKTMEEGWHPHSKNQLLRFSRLIVYTWEDVSHCLREG